MDDHQAAADQVIQNMEKESVSIETLGLAPNSKQNKLFLKLKISKNSLISCGQHICPVCSKGFSSGKALGGHIRIHMKGGISKNIRHRKISKLHQPRNNIHRAKAKKRISKMISTKAMDGGAGNDDLPLINDQQGNNEKEKVSCCICNKDFRSMKSLFGHMRNHPERSWRGIRPPPSDKNSCCSSVCENDAAAQMEVVDQTEKGGSGMSSDDLLKSLPKWTNTYKRCGKFTSDDDDNQITEAAYSLMKLARGDAAFNLIPSTIKVTRSCSFENKFSEEQKQIKIKIGEGKGKQAKLKKMVKYADDAKIIENNNSCFDQFQKFLIKPPDEKDGEIFPSSQTPGFSPKNPSEETNQTTAEGSQVCSPKILDFDLNEPYVALEYGEATT